MNSDCFWNESRSRQTATPSQSMLSQITISRYVPSSAGSVSMITTIPGHSTFTSMKALSQPLQEQSEQFMTAAPSSTMAFEATTTQLNTKLKSNSSGLELRARAFLVDRLQTGWLQMRGLELVCVCP